MRLGRLDLDRYGRFTGESLDFGTAPGDAPDFHVVHGPNEAGKSTLLSAFLDLLFGIEPRSRYDFLHPKPTMRIGAGVEIDGTRHEIARIKRQKNTLLGPDGAPVDPSLLARDLGGIDRAAYRAMFSLDDDTLEEGGESILASRGELGELLFSASAGIGRLSARLATLRAEAEAFHTPNARKSELSRLKGVLSDLRERRRAIDLTAPDHVRLTAERDAAVSACEETAAARAAAQAHVDTLSARRSALPRLARLADLRAELSKVPDLPEPPADWAARLPDLREAEAALTAEQTGLRASLARHDGALENLPDDAAALQAAARIDRLRTGEAGRPSPEARHVTAAEDLPARRRDLDAAETAVAGILARLDAPARPLAAELLLPEAQTAALRDLLAERATLEADRNAARTEAEEAAAELSAGELDAAPALATTALPEAVLSELRAAREAVRRSDHVTRSAISSDRLAALDTRLEEERAALTPWQGSPETLAALPVPGPEQRAAWRAALAAAERRRDTARDALVRARRSHEEALHRHSASETAAGAISDVAAAARRDARDVAWTVHRARLDAESADAFAEALAADDRIGADRLNRATDLAALRERAAALDLAASDLKAAQAEVAAAEQDGQTLRNALDVAAEAVGLPAGTGLPALEDWLTARETVLATRADHAAEARNRDAAHRDAAALHARLSEALGAAGETPPKGAALETLETLADTLIERLDREGRARTEAARDLDRLRRIAETRARRHAQAERCLAEWAAMWSAALAPTWLSASAGNQTPAALAQTLDDLDALARAVERRDGLADRIAKMERDRDAYAAAVAELARTLDEPGAADPLHTADRLRRRLETARTDAARRADTMRARKDTLASLTEIDTRLVEHAARRDAMTGFFSVGSLGEVAAALDTVARRTALAQRIAEEEAALLTGLNVADVATAEADLAGLEADALDTALRDAIARRDQLDMDLGERIARRTRAEDALARLGGDAEAAELDVRIRTVALEIEAGARSHLSARLGVAAAETALGLYRDRNRSAMLDDASRAFAMITGGTYSGLAAHPADGRETLLAERADGASRAAADLSKGTRFQLYLALRLAGYRAFAATRPPVPFVADDIMETFDERRAEAAIRLLVEMARTGQVILLTHHRHLRDIAATIHPTTRMHALDPVP